MLESILVPLDGSTFGEHALPMALALARQSDAEVHLVHVHQADQPMNVGGLAIMSAYDLHRRQDEMAYLSDVVRRLGDINPVRVKVALTDGDVEPALKEYATRCNIDLVVMSTHGRGAFGRFWLGSVADDLMHEMPRPVLMIRPGEGKPDLHREVQLRNILLPVDGSEFAEGVVEPGMFLGRLFDATVTLLRVVPPALRPSYMPEGIGMARLAESELEQLHAAHGKRVGEAEAYLDRLAERVAAGGGRVRTRVLVDEHPAAGILMEAQVSHADLVAMETHGRQGLSRLLWGSVADRVVRSGLVPVLLHRPTRGS